MHTKNLHCTFPEVLQILFINPETDILPVQINKCWVKWYLPGDQNADFRITFRLFTKMSPVLEYHVSWLQRRPIILAVYWYYTFHGREHPFYLQLIQVQWTSLNACRAPLRSEHRPGAAGPASLHMPYETGQDTHLLLHLSLFFPLSALFIKAISTWKQEPVSPLLLERLVAQVFSSPGVSSVLGHNKKRELFKCLLNLWD